VSMSRRRSGSRSNRCRANAGAVVTSKSPKIVEIDLLVRFRENVGHSARWRQQRPGVSLDVNPSIACTVRSSPWPRTCPTIPRGCLSAALKRRIEPHRLRAPAEPAEGDDFHGNPQAPERRAAPGKCRIVSVAPRAHHQEEVAASFGVCCPRSKGRTPAGTPCARVPAPACGVQRGEEQPARCTKRSGCP
jgi:hypothetical protein